MAIDRKRQIAILGFTSGMFKRSASALTEADSGFRPREGMMSVAEQVAHAAQTVDWFREGAFSEKGFDMDFEAHAAQVAAVTSLEAAWAWWDQAIQAMKDVLEYQGDDIWEAPIAEGPVLSGEPRWKIVGGIMEHTAHHRGSLAVYTRLLDRVPPMPYGD